MERFALDVELALDSFLTGGTGAGNRPGTEKTVQSVIGNLADNGKRKQVEEEDDDD